MQALYALDGLGALKVEQVLAAMGDVNEHVRAHAVRLSEKFFGDQDARVTLGKRLDALLDDPSIEVRYQLAFTLGLLRDEQLPGRLAKLLARPDVDAWMEAAVLNSVGEHSLELLRRVNDPAKEQPAALGDVSAKLAEMIASRGFGDEIAAVIELAVQQKSDAAMMRIAAALGAGLHKAGIPLEAEKGQVLIERATALAGDSAADVATRVAAIGVLGAVTWDPSAETLLPLLGPTQPQEIQVAVVGALDQLDRGALAAELLERWNEMSPRLRQTTMAIMIKRPARATALLEAIEAGKIRPSELSSSQAAPLRGSLDKSVKALANRLLAAPAGKRDDVIKNFTPALDLQGDAKHGHEIYLAKCASCHRKAGEGNALGPDLESVKNAGKEKLLANILDPNREVAPNYTAYVVDTDDGDSQVGLIATESAAAVTLRMANGIETVLSRKAIKGMRSTGLSMMPEGLEQGMKPQDLADLMAFVMR
jgi:putative heme-binding domain-containing protein